MNRDTVWAVIAGLAAVSILLAQLVIHQAEDRIARANQAAGEQRECIGRTTASAILSLVVIIDQALAEEDPTPEDRARIVGSLRQARQDLADMQAGRRCEATEVDR